MSKVLKKLYLGDVVKSFGTKQLRKLTTEIPQEDSVIGTWVFNDSLTTTGWGAINTQSNFTAINGYYTIGSTNYSFDGLARWYDELRVILNNGNASSKAYYFPSPYWYDSVFKILTFTSETNDASFVTWLKANATKQESIVGTWRFNDVLVDAISINNNDNKFYLTGDIYCYRNSTTEDRYLDLFEDVTILIRPHDDGVCYFNCEEYAGATARTLYTDGEKGFAGGAINTPDGSMIDYFYTTSSYLLIDKSGEDGKMLRYINIKGGQDVENKTLKAYIKANATKIA